MGTAQPPRPPQPKSGLAPRQWVGIIGLFVFVAIGAWIWVTCGNIIGHPGRQGPDPGSTAAQMCNVFGPDHNPKIVKYDGTWYDTDCLLRFPWHDKG